MAFRWRPITVTQAWFNRLVISAVVLGFLALVVAGTAAAWTVAQVQDHTRWVNHTYEVERAISRYRILIEQTETARRGYLLANDEGFARTFHLSAEGLLPTLETIRGLTVDNTRQQANVRRTVAITQRHLALLNASMMDIRSDGRSAAAARFLADGSVASMRGLRAAEQYMMAEETRLLVLRNAAQEASVQRFYRILAVTTVLLIAVALSSLWIIFRYTRDLGRSRNALSLLNDNLEATVEERTSDLSRANAEIQRFAYIVSHDLRSPLVNVMGFTAELDDATATLGELIDRVEREAPEIVTEKARLAAREDLPEAIGFIRSSTQKMDRLINAILRLSREGRRVIAPERLDMTALVKGIRDSLAHRIAELDGEVRIEKPLPPIVSDRVAMEQVLSNLVENAVKYAAPGRPPVVVVRGRRESGRIVYEVEDNGRGIDPRDHDRVFDLFRRSGVQDQPGEGIGLAHVRALVYRLGGTIQCRSALGEGATFRISLPAVLTGDQGAQM